MVRATLEDISESRFTDETLRRMYRLVDAGKTDAKFQEIAYGVVNRSMPGQWKDYGAELGTLLSWVRRNVDYRRDPSDVELLQDVWRTLSIRRGDCDDLVILLGALIETLGSPVRFVTVSTRPDRKPSHVFLEAHVGGRWTPMDATVQWATQGWQPEAGVTSRKVWTRSDVGLSGYEENPMDGLNGRADFSSGWVNAFPGNPDDFTVAPEMPGSLVVSPRTTPSSEIAALADQKRMVRPDDPGQPYPDTYEIQSHRDLRAEIEVTAPRADVPMGFDPAAWNGRIPEWGPDPSYLFPQNLSREDQGMRDLAGVGDVAAPSIFDSLVSAAKSLFTTGQVPSITEAADLALRVYQEKLAAEMAAKKAEAEAAAQAARVRAASTAPPGAAISAGGLSKWIVPAAVALAVVVVGGAMAKRR